MPSREGGGRAASRCLFARRELTVQILFRAIVSQSNNACSFDGEGRDDGEIIWNQDAIPSTHTLKNLEARILDSNRYQDLSLSLGDNQWSEGSSFGYRLSVSEDSDLLSFLPGDLTEGQVTVAGGREWVESNRKHNINFAMDSQTGRKLNVPLVIIIRLLN